MIRLGQLLKLAGVIGSGSDARELLASERVTVNGEPEERRGRQLHAGDRVSVGDVTLRVVSG
jgi:ribosome-associated protein